MGRLTGIVLSADVSRRPASVIVILLVTGTGGLLLMMAADLWQTIEAVAMRIGVFVAGLLKPKMKININHDILGSISTIQRCFEHECASVTRCPRYL